jgi:glycosyltransferase involved in cell wall biosynthesis
MPRVSVLLPVYNGEPYLQAALDSVLSQDFRDFEVIAINDGSKDRSGDILDACKDSRVRVIHQENRGLALTLNRALELATGEYLARQDADDLSLPQRFTQQVAYLDQHRECGLIGTWSHIWVENTGTDRGHRHPCENGVLQVMSIFDSFFVHSSVMARRSVMEGVGGYPTDPARNPPEDFDLWSRMSRQCQMANLPVPLLIYREVAGSISREKAELIRARVHAIACENLTFELGPEPHKNLYNDLVAAVRGDHRHLSPSPDWMELGAIVSRLQRRMLDRFPQDEPYVMAGIEQLRAKVMHARLANTPLGGGVVRFGRWLKKRLR